MKHEKEIDKMLRGLLFEAWMNDDEYTEAVQKTLDSIGISKQELSNDLEEGIKKGMSVSDQIAMCSMYIKNT